MRNVKSFKKLLAAGMAIVTIAMTPTGVFAEELPSDEYVSGSETVVEEYADDSGAVVEEEYADDSEAVVEEEYADDSEAVIEEEYADDSEIVVEEEYADDSEALNEEIAEEDEVVGVASVLTEAEAVEFLKMQMLNHATTIKFTIKKTDGKYPTFISLRDRAVAYSDSCTGQEGDALAHAGISGSFYATDNGDTVTYTFLAEYWTTLAQENELTTQVNAAMKELNLAGKSEYEKVVAIHNYICNRVDYDYDHLADPSYNLKQTAYAAMINKSAVCEGYATLFYRMCKEAGLSVRIITGTSRAQNHAWNIVKIGDLYYNVDSTWDGQDQFTYSTYLACGKMDFDSHVPAPEYKLDSFVDAYPMAKYKYGWSPVKENDTNPTVTFTDTKGNTLTTTANNKALVLAFIGHSCSNSAALMQELDDFADIYDVDVYAIDIQDASFPSNLTTFISNNVSADTKIHFVEYDKGRTLYSKYLTGTDLAAYRGVLPYVVFIDRNNKIQQYRGGYIDSTLLGEYLELFCGVHRQEVPITIDKQPVIAESNEYYVRLEMTAHGFGLQYLWQESTDGTNWTTAEDYYSGVFSNYLLVNYTRENEKKMYRCRIKDEDGKIAYTNTISFSMPKIQFLGCSAGVGLEIGVSVFFTISDDLDKASSYVYIKQGNKETEFPLKDMNPGYADRYFVGAWVAPKDVGDAIEIYVREGNNSGKVFVKSFTMKEYLMAIIRNEGSTYEDEYVERAKAVLNYAGYAQIYFDYKTDSLVNKGLYTQSTDPVLNKSINIDSYYRETGNVSNDYLEFVGGSLVCDGATGIKLYFKEKKPVSIGYVIAEFSDTGYSIWPDYLQVYKTNGFVVVYMKGFQWESDESIAANVDIEIFHNGQWLDMNYSVTTYIYQAQKSNNEKLKNLTKAMWLVYETSLI